MTEVTPSALVMGEALIDLVFDPRKDESEPTPVPGGSPANVALTLGRLGIDVDLVTWIGTDPYGQMVSRHLKESNVRVYDGCDGAPFTSTAEAHLDSSGAATYTFNLEWAPPAPVSLPAGAAVVHTGSIGAVLEPGTATIFEAFKEARGQALTTYDPNARPTLMGDVDSARAVIEGFVAQSDVVKVSDEDLQWLYPSLTALEAAHGWTDRFHVPLIVVTRGKEGPIGWTASGVQSAITPQKVSVVDTVGAGDSFMGGLIDALWRRDIVGSSGKEALLALDEAGLRSILADAAQIADIVVQRRGANPPWASELSR